MCIRCWPLILSSSFVKLKLKLKPISSPHPPSPPSPPDRLPIIDEETSIDYLPNIHHNHQQQQLDQQQQQNKQQLNSKVDKHQN